MNTISLIMIYGGIVGMLLEVLLSTFLLYSRFYSRYLIGVIGSVGAAMAIMGGFLWYFFGG